MKIKPGALPESYVDCFKRLNQASRKAKLEYMLVGATAKKNQEKNQGKNQNQKTKEL